MPHKAVLVGGSSSISQAMVFIHQTLHQVVGAAAFSSKEKHNTPSLHRNDVIKREFSSVATATS